MKAIVMEKSGGPEVFEYKEVEKPEPKANEALVKIEAAGVNFIDIYQRTGLYETKVPAILGNEAAGVIESLGSDVKDFKVGDRVAYTSSLGNYAEYAAVPAARLVRIPDGVDSQTAAAAMLQGMTVHYLVTSTYALKSEDTVLLHAAAGGVGLFLTQVAKRIGARVIGTVSTEAKAELAREAGADEVINYTEQDFEEEVKRLTGGRGVQVVYDSVGKDTYLKSMNSLVPRGMLVLFGQSSGAVPAIDPLILTQKGSIFLTRPSLNHYTLTREELEHRAGEVFRWLGTGEVKLKIERVFPLAEAAEAHRLLESRKTTGKLLLVN
jgi:NADPH2:quinone reductase